MSLRHRVATGGKTRVQRARLRADRTSSHLSNHDVQKVVAATCFASDVGLPFNRFVSINWTAAGIIDSLAATGGFLKLIGDFVRVHGGVTAYAYVREGGPGKGDHVHILMHVAPSLCRKLSYRHARWLKLLGGRVKEGWINTRSIGHTLGQAMTLHSEMAYRANLNIVLRYILKGVHPETGERLGLSLIEEQGLIIGKRSGVSENIGEAARRRAGLRDVNTAMALDRLADVALPLPLLDRCP